MNSYSLSTVCGRRLCKITGGKYDDKYIYLYDSKYKCCPNCKEECGGDCCNDCCLYNYHQKSKNNKMIDYCKIEDEGVFMQAPTNIIKMRDCLNVSAKSGAGKSVYVANYLKEYRTLYPKNKVFLFSMKKEDENLDPYIDKRINLNKYVEKGGLTIDDFGENCFIVFDDIDQLDNSKPDYLRDRIFKLMNQVIQISRSKNIGVVQTSHVCLGNSETKALLNAMTSFTFFYAAISAQIKQCFKTYIGLSKQQIKRISSVKDSRWGTIFLTSPMVFLSEKECFIILEE